MHGCPFDRTNDARRNVQSTILSINFQVQIYVRAVICRPLPLENDGESPLISEKSVLMLLMIEPVL